MYSNRLLALFLTTVLLISAPLAAQDAPPTRQPPPTDSPPAAAPADQSTPDSREESAQGGAGEGGRAAPAADDPPSPDAADVTGDEATTAETDAAPEDREAGVPWSDAIEKVVGKNAPDNLEDLRTIQEQVRGVVDFARPATVGVQVGGAVGSAVIVSQDGLVLTAGHVAMRPNQRVRFFFADGTTARGVTLGVNTGIDSGMMRITDKGPWPFVPMAPVGSVQPGDWVVGLGQPNGYFEDRAPPVRLGRILYGDDSTLCTDVTLVGGDSGGPLFNLKGEVVGIHSRIGRRIVSNYHVPIDQYHGSWDRLANSQMWGGDLGASEPTQRRAFLGIAGNSLSGRCRVTQVYEGRPADRAGIQVGDIVTRFDEQEVDSFSQLAQLVVSQRPGAQVKIEIERNGKTVELQARLSIASVDFPGSPPADSDS